MATTTTNSSATARVVFVTFSLMLACLLNGCGPSIQSKLVGNWQIEKAEQVTGRFNNNESADTAAETPPSMAIQFRSDGSFQTTTKMGRIDQVKEGTWKLKSETDSKAEIECLIEGQTTSQSVEFHDPKTIKLTPPNMAGVRMKLEFKKE